MTPPQARRCAPPPEVIVDLPQDGGRYRVRPARPDDVPALRALLRRLSPDEVRLRFFTPMREFSDALLQQLLRVDASRLSLVALRPDDALIGTAMLAPDDDGVSAEFAVIVQRDCGHHGLGRVLIERLIASARAAGLEQIYGIVLRDNFTMRELAGEIGFSVGPEPGEPECVRVTYRLR